VPQAPIVALHRHLRADQALLNDNAGAKIAAQCDRMALAHAFAWEVQGQYRVRQCQVGAVRRGVIDMAPVLGSAGLGIAQQGFDLGAALDRDGIGPALADPMLITMLEQLFAAEGEVADHSIFVHDQSHIRTRGDQGRRDICMEVAKVLLGFGKVTYARR
jgi:hypothetical protein